MSKWTLFSNHGHVLVVLSRDPDARLRDVAQTVGITERAVQKIVRDLQDGGLVSVTKRGRRNRYRLHPNQPLRHTLEAHCTTGELLDMVNRRAPGTEPAETEAETPVAPPPETRPGPRRRKRNAPRRPARHRRRRRLPIRPAIPHRRPRKGTTAARAVCSSGPRERLP